MKFFTSRIAQITPRHTTLEDALASAKNAQPLRTVDQILADIDAQKKQVKTASAEKPVVTAAKVEAPKAEAPKADAPKVEAPKVAASVPVKVEVKIAKKEAKKDVTLKVASSLDFRNWEASEIVSAWAQHGSIEKCIANVKGDTSDAKTYCGLLRVAASEASKVVKTAAKPQKEVKVAFKKFAKLTDDEKSFLREYWTELYGKEYVEAMVAEA